MMIYFTLLPFFHDLKRCDTPVVEVDPDLLIKKELPVQIDWVGKLPHHFILKETIITPKKVGFIGGKRMLEKGIFFIKKTEKTCSILVGIPECQGGWRVKGISF